MLLNRHSRKLVPEVENAPGVACILSTVSCWNLFVEQNPLSLSLAALIWSDVLVWFYYGIGDQANQNRLGVLVVPKREICVHMYMYIYTCIYVCRIPLQVHLTFFWEGRADERRRSCCCRHRFCASSASWAGATEKAAARRRKCSLNLSCLGC